MTLARSPRAMTHSRGAFDGTRVGIALTCCEFRTVPGHTGGSPNFYGNMLTVDSAARGLNFLSADIFELARQRVARGSGAVEEFRLMRNMLASQPMCFNLFGPLALNHDRNGPRALGRAREARDRRAD